METAKVVGSILCRKGIAIYLSNSPPVQKMELRVEQFLECKILNFMKRYVELICEIVKHRKGNIIKSKDFKFLFYQNNLTKISNLNFLNPKMAKIKKTSKVKKKKI